MQRELLLSLTLALLATGAKATDDHSTVIPNLPAAGISSCPGYCFDIDEEDVEIGVEHMFAPLGFDEGDTWPEVVLIGWLASTCYRQPRAEVKREGGALVLSVRATQNLSPSRICLNMAVPFLVSASLGKLEHGDYTVRLSKSVGHTQETLMRIAPSSSAAVDDYVYAQVEHVEKDAGSNKAFLIGHNPSDCVELDRIETISNGYNTYAVLPIMKQVKADCPRMSVPFSYEIDLPHTLTAQKILLHVRSLEGKSVNFVFDN